MPARTRVKLGSTIWLRVTGCRNPHEKEDYCTRRCPVFARAGRVCGFSPQEASQRDAKLARTCARSRGPGYRLQLLSQYFIGWPIREDRIASAWLCLQRPDCKFWEEVLLRGDHRRSARAR